MCCIMRLATSSRNAEKKDWDVDNSDADLKGTAN